MLNKGHLLLLLILLAPCRIVNAQIDTAQNDLNEGDANYRIGDFATGLINYQNALENALNIKENTSAKDSLKFLALKKLITVAGMGKAPEMAISYFQKYKTDIYSRLCHTEHLAVQIGIINNYIAISVYNGANQEAINAYEYFKQQTANCSNFREVDMVQSSANAAMAYAKMKQPLKALEIIPLLNYFKDSLNNWRSSDYNKVLGVIETNTNEPPERVIAHFIESADTYTKNNQYRYALNLYEVLLSDYSQYMNNAELINLTEKVRTVRDSSEFYHNALYQKMMRQLGVVMLERSEEKEQNTSLKAYLQYAIYTAFGIVISLMLFLNKKNKTAKIYYKKWFTLEQRFERQQKKLHLLKENFLKTNYTLNLEKANPNNFIGLAKALDQDFPELKYNILQHYKYLSNRDIQIIYCALLSLSTKESANLLALTHGAFRVAKNRLIKKMNCETSDEFQKNIKALL